jgi:hypothetical protein
MSNNQVKSLNLNITTKQHFKIFSTIKANADRSDLIAKTLQKCLSNETHSITELFFIIAI